MAWISWRNYIDRAELTASAQAGGLAATRVRIPTVARRWRVADLAPGATAHYLDAALDGAYRPGVACFVRPRRRAYAEEVDPPSFGPSDTVRHRLSTVDDFATTVYDSGVIGGGVALGYGYHCHLIPDGAPGGFYRFDFDAVSRDTAPDNFVDWGYAHVGPIDLEPEIGFIGPSSRDYSEGAARRFNNENSAIVVRRRQARRRWNLAFRSIKTTELPGVEAFLEYAGDGGRFLVGLDRTDLSRGVMVGMLDSAGYARTSRQRSALTLPILEAL